MIVLTKQFRDMELGNTQASPPPPRRGACQLPFATEIPCGREEPPINWLVKTNSSNLVDKDDKQDGKPERPYNTFQNKKKMPYDERSTVVKHCICSRRQPGGSW